MYVCMCGMYDCCAMCVRYVGMYVCYGCVYDICLWFDMLCMYAM